MTIPDPSAVVPLRSGEEVEARVAELVGRALRRQLWLLFLDADGAQLPVIMPCDDLPTAPGPHDRALFARAAGTFVDHVGAASLLLVLERPGPVATTTADLAWARTLHEACDDAGVRLRAIVLAASDAVRTIQQDDYRFADAA